MGEAAAVEHALGGRRFALLLSEATLRRDTAELTASTWAMMPMFRMSLTWDPCGSCVACVAGVWALLTEKHSATTEGRSFLLCRRRPGITEACMLGRGLARCSSTRVLCQSTRRLARHWALSLVSAGSDAVVSEWRRESFRCTCRFGQAVTLDRMRAHFSKSCSTSPGTPYHRNTKY